MKPCLSLGLVAGLPKPTPPALPLRAAVAGVTNFGGGGGGMGALGSSSSTGGSNPNLLAMQQQAHALGSAGAPSSPQQQQQQQQQHHQQQQPLSKTRLFVVVHKVRGGGRARVGSRLAAACYDHSLVL